MVLAASIPALAKNAGARPERSRRDRATAVSKRERKEQEQTLKVWDTRPLALWGDLAQRHEFLDIRSQISRPTDWNSVSELLQRNSILFERAASFAGGDYLEQFPCGKIGCL